MAGALRGPVGLRWRTQNVDNWQQDQIVVIDLLSKIDVANGGQKQNWPAPPLPGPDHSCPKFLADAIWTFQLHWKQRGKFQNIDGVVDKYMNTIKMMWLLADADKPPTPPTPSPKRHIEPPLLPGTWQIKSVSSWNLGEVGLLGGATVEVRQSDGKVFGIVGLGAGFGVSVDPSSFLKYLKNVKDPTNNPMLKQIIAMLTKNVSFSIGDFLQLLGLDLQSITLSKIYPVGDWWMGRPPLSQHLLVNSGNSIMVHLSAGGGAVLGSEAGVILFNVPLEAINPIPSAQKRIMPGAVAVYGSGGLTLKVGGAITGMAYNTKLSGRDWF